MVAFSIIIIVIFTETAMNQKPGAKDIPQW